MVSRNPVITDVPRLKSMSLALEAFVENVREFCDWIESDQHTLQPVRQTLLALLQGTPYLVVSGSTEPAADDFPRREHSGWLEDVARLKELPLQYYRVAFDPLAIDDETAVVGDVCDDLADIYGELWHGLQAYDAGSTIYAVNHWRDSFRFHWGLHATGAIAAIDAYLRRQESGEPDDARESPR
ncbi:DUF5063 domain-containing protein [Rhodopirellula europaea]|nr:DUF5063 domain-containing protein [Rhodopirellula europaea]